MLHRQIIPPPSLVGGEECIMDGFCPNYALTLKDLNV